MSGQKRSIDRNESVMRARALRRTPSLLEILLWQVLRRRPGGLKFRHQHPLGPYTGDFYCAAAKLVIELDGESHGMGGRPARDARRDEWLVERGMRVVRFTAAEVLKDLESVVTAILLAVRQVPPRREMGRGTS